MKLQFPYSVGVFVASFAAVGCGISNSEIPDRQFWVTDGAVDAAIDFDASLTADGGTDSDGAVYGNDGGGNASHAGAGGQAHHAGGSGGDDEPVAGSGGGEEPVAGSGSEGGAGGSEEPVAGSGGGNTCPSAYTMATHIVMNVTWPKTEKFGQTIVKAGGGKVHIWSKSFFDEDGNTASVRSKSCGATLPAINVEAISIPFIANYPAEKLLPEIPNATWDKPSMPEFIGSSTKTDNTVTASTGTALVGLTMSADPDAEWPMGAGTIMGVDHDGDGPKGIAAIPKEDSGYSAIPLDTSKSKRADRVDLAIRTIMTLNATLSGDCPETYAGTASVSAFDNHIIGCHVKGGGECDLDQRTFVDENRTIYTVTSATFTAERVSDSASCADVRAAVP